MENVFGLQYLKQYTNKKIWGSGETFKSWFPSNLGAHPIGNGKNTCKMPFLILLWKYFASRIFARPRSRHTKWFPGGTGCWAHSGSVFSRAGEDMCLAYPKTLCGSLNRQKVCLLPKKKFHETIHLLCRETGNIGRVENNISFLRVHGREKSSLPLAPSERLNWTI